MDREEFKHTLEALIFASKTPLTVKQIIAILPEETPETIRAAVAQVEEELKGRAFTLKKVAGGYQFASKPEYSQWISKMFEEKERSRLSRAALETLAIVAFKQPISRVEISAIRGVNSDGVMKTLLDGRLVTISGRDHGPGRALLFRTTPEFLHYFGINDISDLPRPREVEELLAEGEGGQLLKELPDELLLSDAGIQAKGDAQVALDSALSDEKEKSADDTAQ